MGRQRAVSRRRRTQSFSSDLQRATKVEPGDFHYREELFAWAAEALETGDWPEPEQNRPAGKLSPIKQAAGVPRRLANPSPSSGDDLFGRAWKPRHRPATPVLTILDDGISRTGEHHRIRKQTFRIGRTTGDLTFPADPTMSNQHAEIAYDIHAGHWVLRDLASKNGTFIRVSEATLRSKNIFLLGSLRYRIVELPAGMIHMWSTPAGQLTKHGSRNDVSQAIAAIQPVDGTCGGQPCPLIGETVTIGSDPIQSDIHLPDPELAAVHARLSRAHDQTWIIRSITSRNGVWIRIHEAVLRHDCFFQCGDYRFRVVVP